VLGGPRLASYAWLRHDAVVMRRQDPGRADRAQAVVAVLLGYAAHPHPWQDPPPQLLRHPLQALRLGEPRSGVAQECTDEAALLSH
jgi:hypothetical protein